MPWKTVEQRREYEQIQRAKLTPEEREARNARQRTYNHTHQDQLRQSEKARYVRDREQILAKQKTEVARANDARNHRLARLRETPEQRTKRLEKSRAYNKLHRMSHRLQKRTSYPLRKDREREWKRNRYLVMTAVRHSTPPGAHLYIMKRSDVDGLFKVGHSADPTFRAKELSAGHIFTVEIIRIYEHLGSHEQEVHDALEDYRAVKHIAKRGKVSGCEWFWVSQEKLFKIMIEVLSPYEH